MHGIIICESVEFHRNRQSCAETSLLKRWWWGLVFYDAKHTLTNKIIVSSAMADIPDNLVVPKGSVLSLTCPVRSQDCKDIVWAIVGGDFINTGMTVGDTYQNLYYVNSTGGYCMLFVRILDMTPVPPLYCVQGTKSQKTFHVYVTGRLWWLFKLRKFVQKKTFPSNFRANVLNRFSRQMAESYRIPHNLVRFLQNVCKS